MTTGIVETREVAFDSPLNPLSDSPLSSVGRVSPDASPTPSIPAEISAQPGSGGGQGNSARRESPQMFRTNNFSRKVAGGSARRSPIFSRLKT